MYNTTYYHAIYIDWLKTDTLTPGAYHMAFKREKRKKKKINEPVFSFEREKYGSYQTISFFFFIFLIDFSLIFKKIIIL